MHCSKTHSLPAAALLLLYSVYGAADTVVLKNGKTFEGIIKKETQSDVTINIGLGTIAFNRDQIETVKRSTTTRVENQWQRQYFSQGKYVPAGLEDLAADFNALVSSRRAAMKASADNRRLQQQRARLIAEMTTRKQEIAHIAQQFQSIVLEKNVSTYNALVKKQNGLAARVIVISERLQDQSGETAKNRKTVSKYRQLLSNYKAQHEARKSAYPNPPDDEKVAFFFAEIDQRILAYSTEFQQTEIPHQQQGEHMIVTVRLNNKIDGRFLLDTGASFVTLSNDIARRLDLNLSPAQGVPLTLANGSQVNAQPVVLQSVQVGDARVKGVVAMIFPEPLNDSVDGLLGMSFLKEFTINLDPANKTLVFEKFDPD